MKSVYVGSKRNIESEQVNEEIKPKEYKETKDAEKIWQIEIPKIDLIAPIAEGTTQEVMNKYVGHFENTDIFEGNVGLAAHNRRISSQLFW